MDEQIRKIINEIKTMDFWDADIKAQGYVPGAIRHSMWSSEEWHSEARSRNMRKLLLLLEASAE